MNRDLDLNKCLVKSLEYVGETRKLSVIPLKNRVTIVPHSVIKQGKYSQSHLLTPPTHSSEVTVMFKVIGSLEICKVGKS